MTQSKTFPACPRCGKPVEIAGASFCPHCGAPVAAAQAAAVPEGALSLLEKAERQTDPVKKHKLLLEAQAQYPDCLEVAQELLFLGRLYERSPKKLDFSVIKCHLLHFYLTPDDFSAAQQQQMRTELFDHPDLRRCQELAPDPDAFTRKYLERLCRDFINVFLRGSNRYMHSFFGFRLDSRIAKVLASPLERMLSRVHGDTDLDFEQRSMLYDALYRAFLLETGNDAKWLDALLAGEGISLGLYYCAFLTGAQVM